MHAGNVHKVTLDTDENGYELTLETDTGIWTFNVQPVAEELYDACRVEIRPWLREAAHAKANMPRVSDQDLAEFMRGVVDKHSVRADLWDAREGK